MKLDVKNQSFKILSNCHWALRNGDISKLRTGRLENKNLRNFAKSNTNLPFIEESFALFDQHYQYNYSTLTENLAKTQYFHDSNEMQTITQFFSDESIKLHDNHSNTTCISELIHLINVHHEYYHLLSSYFNNSLFFSGFSCSSEYEKTIGRGLNEGSTDALVYKDMKIDIPVIAYRKDMDQDNVYLYYGYGVENSLSSSLCDIIGEHKFREAFIKGDLDMLIKEITPYQSRGEIWNWISNFDKMHCELELNRKTGGSTPIDTITEVKDFLVDTFENKYKSSFFKPSRSEFYDNIIQYVGYDSVPYTNKMLSLGIRP